MLKSPLQLSVTCLQAGGVIAYPTEAVFGLGCDPDNSQAIERLLTLKTRPKAKGLILVASDWQQLQPFVDFKALSDLQLERVLSSWPGATTWIIPSTTASPWLSGQFNSLAVRVSSHPVVQQLCRAFGKPIVSTSANLAGQQPAKTELELVTSFGDSLDYIYHGQIGSLNQPTKIIDALTSECLRG